MIDQMPLYVNVERIYAELTELGLAPHDRLRPEQLFPFDQFHYHGIDAIQRGSDALQLNAGSHVLDVGSGLGGPARYLAHNVGCHVTALELQSRLHNVAIDLTVRCALEDRVRHVQGDALNYPLPDEAFHAVVSWMAIHHIPSRAQLLTRLRPTLQPGGALYVEDLYARQPFDHAIASDVARLLHGVTMTSWDVYESDLRAAGFTNVEIEDQTEDWGTFCAKRATRFRADRARFARVHGDATYATLDDFFSGVARLFASGCLGGVRFSARVTQKV